MKYYSTLLLGFAATGILAQNNVLLKDTFLFSTASVSAPIRNGAFITYFNNNTISTKSWYKNNLLDSIQLDFFPNGKKHIKANYKEGKLHGKETYYYENGNLLSIANYKEGFLDGQKTTYYENGKIKEEAFYNKGKLDGITMSYYSNGNPKWKGSYKDGKMFGERLCYNENGNLCSGYFISYINNVKERECECINGRPEGELKLYSSGKVSMIVNFKAGKPDGTVYSCSNDKVYPTQLYKDGVFVRELSKDGTDYQFNDKIDIPGQKMDEKDIKNKLMIEPK